MAPEQSEDQVNEETEAATAEASEAPEAPETSAEPEPALHPKEARRRRRSVHSGEARPPREAGERQTEREAQRKEKARRRSAYRTRARARAAERRAAQPPAEPLEPLSPSTGRPKQRQGVVVSDRPDKSITVRVDLARRHRLYQKTVRSSSTLHVHDERNEARAGDTVRVVESRPLSKTKRWRLVEVVERAR
jgi:small subunit ribosomal protein S17